MINKELAKQAGLVQQGKDFEGNDEYIGTNQQWAEYERLFEIDDRALEIQEFSKDLSNTPLGQGLKKVLDDINEDDTQELINEKINQDFQEDMRSEVMSDEDEDYFAR